MTLKETAKTLLIRSRLLRLRQRMLPASAVVLAYHSVSTDRAGQERLGVTAGITTDAALFREHMRILRREYYPVTLDDLVRRQRSGEPLPRRAVAVTFDDGYEDNDTVAAPAMERYDIRGAVYMTVGCSLRRELPWFCRTYYLFKGEEPLRGTLTDPRDGQVWDLADPVRRRAAYLHCNHTCAVLGDEDRRRYLAEVESRAGRRLDPAAAPKMLTFEQARDMRRRGHVIGNHSFSHGNLANLPEDALRKEIVEAHEILCRELREPVVHFSYPHPCLQPQWNETTRAMTESLGYRTAVLTRPGIVLRDTPLLLLPRIHVGNETPRQFRWKLETALAGVMV